jgi:hypothetical protein
MAFGEAGGSDALALEAGAADAPDALEEQQGRADRRLNLQRHPLAAAPGVQGLHGATATGHTGCDGARPRGTIQPMNPLALVLPIVALLAALVAFVVVLRRRSATRTAAFVAELAAAGEQVTRGPESVLYTGATDVYSRVGNNGALTLTERRLVFHTLFGGGFEVPAAEIVGVREERWLNGKNVGAPQTIVRTRSGAEVGFVMPTHAEWMAALRALPSVAAAVEGATVL